MIAIHFLVKVFFLIQVFSTTILAEANQLRINPENVLCQAIPLNEAALGVWAFTMTKVKSPYTDGELFIIKEQGSYKVAIKFSMDILTGQDVVIADNRINFNMNISGLERVSFELLVDGDCIMGESYSINGSSQIQGSRKYPGS